MKNVALLFLVLPFFGLTQQHNFDPDKRMLIDSIHSNRLCVVYPGMTRFLTTKEAYDESQLVFTGKVVEIIRVEKTIQFPIVLDPEGQPHREESKEIFQFFYILKANQFFKGKQQEYIKIFSRAYSSVHPMLMLNSEYLIYAVEPEDAFIENPGEEIHVPYIYCNSNSSHLKYAGIQLEELENIIKN